MAILRSLRIDCFRTTAPLGHLLVPRRRPSIRSKGTRQDRYVGMLEFSNYAVLSMSDSTMADVKKWRCLSSFNLRLKTLISEVTVEQQILALVCYVSVALIRKIAKRTRILTFD